MTSETVMAKGICERIGIQGSLLTHKPEGKEKCEVAKDMPDHKVAVQMVLDMLDKEIAPLGIGKWHKPNGGYFVSFDTIDGCAKRVCQLCKEAGVVLTGAGATFPYGKDPKDSNIRIAPSFPPVSELESAMEVFTLAVKLATAEKMLEE